MAKRIVLWHLDNATEVGTVFDATKGIANAEDRGEIVTLPVDERLLDNPANVAVAGFYRRDYGTSGPRFAAMKPTRSCSALLWVTPDLPFLHFAVRLAWDGAQNCKPRGVVRLSGGPNAMGAFVGGIGAVGAKELVLDELVKAGEVPREELAGASWILSGRANLAVQTEGYLSCSLQAVAEGVRVVWIAVSQSSQER